MIRIKNGRPVSKLANPLLCSLCGIAPEEAADADRIALLHMNQIYFNLLSNAVKYTPEGGSISVRVSQTLTDGGRDRLTVSVSDNGIGMPAPPLRR